MAKLGAVRQLNPKTEGENVYATIHTYLSRKAQNSENTRGTYERSIRDFFKTMRGKELKDLNPDDLIFTPSQIGSYQVALKEQYKGGTVNNTFSSLRELYKRFEDDGFKVRRAWFDVESYGKHDVESYDTLTHEEILAIINLVSTTRKGLEKSLLVRVAYATAFRKDSIRTAKWDQIINIDGVWFMKVLGKGNKWSHKKISNDLYKALMSYKEARTKDSDNIFELTDKTISKMMKYIRDNIDFGNRKIVFHSIKKASINEVNIITGGDIKAMQQHGDHNNVSTTLNDYMAKKNLEELVTVDINTKIPVEEFDRLSTDDLLGLIKNVDRTTQIKLLQKLGVM